MQVDALLGSRVALRHRVGERDGRGLFTDAVGELSADGDVLVVDTRRGPVRVSRAAVVAVRAVPPQVPRRASWSAVTRLEHLCADAWPAPVDEPLGHWRLRAAGGYTGRANSALAAGDPGMPVTAALDLATAFARRHGIGPRVQVPVGSPWDTAVAAAGWELDAGHAAGAEVAVLVTELDALVRAAPVEPAARITTPQSPDDDWWALGLDGVPPSPAQRAVVSPDGALPIAYLLARDPDGTPLGQVRAAVVQDHVHLSWLTVTGPARRRGLGTALGVAAARWAQGHGARFGVLQVALDNVGARAHYTATGWVEHHQYHYLVLP